jgi:thioredoxin 1
MSVKTITASNFEAEVLQSNKPVLVDFWASWCGPCRMLSPVVDELAENDLKDTAVVGKVNVDEEPELAQRFGVMSIPTLIVFKNGKAVNKSVGVKPRGAILQMVND